MTTTHPPADVGAELLEAARGVNWSRVADVGERLAAFAAVAAVAGFAAVISYTHIRDLAASHSAPGSGVAAALLPLAIDGTIVAASLVLFTAARRHVPAPPLARWMLYGGILATIAANVDYGARWGPTGAILWALPAAAFCGGVELLAAMARLGTAAAAAAIENAKLREAIAVYGEMLGLGELPSVRSIKRDLKVGQPHAKLLRARLAELLPAA